MHGSKRLVMQIKVSQVIRVVSRSSSPGKETSLQWKFPLGMKIIFTKEEIYTLFFDSGR